MELDLQVLQSAYCGAKHVIQRFSEAIRSELLHNKSNIWDTMVQLPAVNTKLPGYPFFGGILFSICGKTAYQVFQKEN
jgi:hypothetical protein